MVCFSSLRGLPSFSTLEPQTQRHVQAEGREEWNADKKNPHRYTRIDFSSNDVRSACRVKLAGLPVVRADGVQDVLHAVLPLHTLLAFVYHR